MYIWYLYAILSYSLLFKYHTVTLNVRENSLKLNVMYPTITIYPKISSRPSAQINFSFIDYKWKIFKSKFDTSKVYYSTYLLQVIRPIWKHFPSFWSDISIKSGIDLVVSDALICYFLPSSFASMTTGTNLN